MANYMDAVNCKHTDGMSKCIKIKKSGSAGEPK